MSGICNIQVSFNKPLNIQIWNSAAEQNAQFWASTVFDEIQRIYNKKPVYIEAYRNGEWMGGLKVLLSDYRKFRAIANRWFREAYIQGEVICNNNSDSVEIVFTELVAFANNWLRQQGVISVKVSPYNARPSLLPSFGTAHQFKEFCINHLKIDAGLENIFSAFHPKHRNLIRKAQKQGVDIVEEYDFELFYEKLLKNTYSDNENKLTDKAFLRTFCNVTQKARLMRMFFAIYNGQYCAAAIVISYGNMAEYSFGGNIKTNIGAGVLLQWHIIKELSQSGIQTYSLGQTAANYDASNEKFSLGITRFKNRFGGENIPVWSGVFVYRPVLKKFRDMSLKMYLTLKKMSAR